MSRRSIRKQQIEAVHDLLDRPAFRVYTFMQPGHSGRFLPDIPVEHFRVMDNPERIRPLNMSAEIPTAMDTTYFNYVTTDRANAFLVARSKNAEAIVDAVRELSK